MAQEEEYGDIGAYFGTKPDVAHMWGFQYLLSEWQMGEEFFWECKKASPLSLAAAACHSGSHHTPSPLVRTGQLYISVHTMHQSQIRLTT